jgi:hypothetical protein
MKFQVIITGSYYTEAEKISDIMIDRTKILKELDITSMTVNRIEKNE